MICQLCKNKVSKLWHIPKLRNNLLELNYVVIKSFEDVSIGAALQTSWSSVCCKVHNCIVYIPFSNRQNDTLVKLEPSNPRYLINVVWDILKHLMPQKVWRNEHGHSTAKTVTESVTQTCSLAWLYDCSAISLSHKDIFCCPNFINVQRMNNRCPSLQFSFRESSFLHCKAPFWKKNISSKEANSVDALDRIVSNMATIHSRALSQSILFMYLKRRRTDLYADVGQLLRGICGAQIRWEGCEEEPSEEEGWRPCTNKYLFRILHSTLLQRVWFPGSTALLMHPSPPSPQSTESKVGTQREEGREQLGVGLKERAKLYVKVANQHSVVLKERIYCKIDFFLLWVGSLLPL